MPPLPRAAWGDQADAVLDEIAAWRLAHPRATWAEIEAAVDAGLAGLRAQVLQDSAHASPAADPALAERPRCPDCGAAVQAAGARGRRLTTDGDQVVELTRTYLRCPACGAGLFPPR